jgi:eukaryotic-like serine/threonine-protein kinase
MAMIKSLGKFEILGKIGQGAMGVVYKARDPFIGRLVALKTITTGLTDDPALLERFYQEARSAGALQHPNIVTIFELGKQDDTPFIAMQYLEGESLDRVIDRQPVLPLSQKLGYIVYVCRALEYAHKRGVVHRDIKPGNVMVTTEGTVMVVDFGIARLAESSKTQSGLIIGTLGYMSPQLLRGGRAEARSDIWAVGVMLYELLAYQRPFNGDNQAALMMNILTQEMPPLSETAPGTPEDVSLLLARMLQKDIGGRFQSMEEVLIELEPVWRRLQQSEVSSLIDDGHKLFELREFTKAQDVLRRVLQIDTANTLAKNLLEKVNTEVRRNQILPQMKSRVEKAQNFLAARQLDEAKAEAEAALQLDSTFQPARELLEQVQAAAERARALAQSVRIAKQRIAEGALTEAEAQIGKVLEIEAGNSSAHELLKQIREEKARRERQKRLSEILRSGRALWSNLRYDESIQLLTDAQREFPAEAEIAKLLETARQDLAEQERQQLLAQARNLVGSQSFDQAVEILDRVLELNPGDSSARNLRAHALQGRQQKLREERLNQEMAELRARLKAGKYQEAIIHGERLLGEFPGEFELSELIAYARSEHLQLEQRRRLEQSIEQVREEIGEGRFREAIGAAQKALGEFPKNTEIVTLLERAKEQQKEKQTRELLEQRVKEIDSLIERQEFTDAIGLARQTLVTVRADPEVSRRLQFAQLEYEQREKRKKEQQQTYLAAQTLVDAGNPREATRILREALETRLFSASDPRLTQLFKDIEERQAPPPPPPPPAEVKPAAPTQARASKTGVAWPQATSDPAKDYVYQQGGVKPTSNLPQDAATAYSSATVMAGGNILSPGQETQVSQGHVQQLPEPRPLPPAALAEAVSAVTDASGRKRRNHQLLLGACVCAAVFIASVAFFELRPKTQAVVESKATQTAITQPQEAPAVTTGAPRTDEGATQPVQPARPAIEQPQAKVPPTTTAKVPPNQPAQPATALAGAPADLLASIRNSIGQGNFAQARQTLTGLSNWRSDHDQMARLIEAGERSFVDQARSQATAAKNSGDSNTLSNLQSKLRSIETSGSPAANDARDLAERVIPDSLKSITDGKEAQTRFDQATDDFNNAVRNKDGNALSSRVLLEFQRIAETGGPYSDQAREYVRATVPDAIARLKPAESPAPAPEPKPKASEPPAVAVKPPAAVGDSGSDIVSIVSVVNQFYAAFTEGDIDRIKTLRQLNGNDEKKFRDSLKELRRAKGFETSVQGCSTPQITGDNASLRCMVISRARDSAPQSNASNITLRRIGGRWMIVSTN